MNLGEKLESSVKLSGLYFEKIDFWRSGEAVVDDELTVVFSKSYNFNEEHTACAVTLGCIIRDQAERAIRIEVRLRGAFSCESPLPERKEVLLTKNTLAILFPYLRSEISILTAQPGLTPVVLPTLKIEAVFDAATEGGGR